jgi:hypothetical protein
MPSRPRSVQTQPAPAEGSDQAARYRQRKAGRDLALLWRERRDDFEANCMTDDEVPATTVTVNTTELRTTFEFVSAGALFEHSAYICRDTGKIYCSFSAGLAEEADLPEDLETSDLYIAVPHKNELGLGSRLALAFVDQELPDDYHSVAGYFRRRGAYRRFKELLDARGKLQSWYEFETHAMEEALLAWCEENGIQPVDDESAP